MTNSDPSLRSFQRIGIDDLRHLAELARLDREDFFERYPRWRSLYSDRVLGSALCQGAALHYVAGAVGINDFDVYTFYAANPVGQWCYRRMKSVDFGDPKFGRSEIAPEHYLGRRVDLMGRALAVPAGTHFLSALVGYLRQPQTDTAREFVKVIVRHYALIRC